MRGSPSSEPISRKSFDSPRGWYVMTFTDGPSSELAGQHTRCKPDRYNDACTTGPPPLLCGVDMSHGGCGVPNSRSGRHHLSDVKGLLAFSLEWEDGTHGSSLVLLLWSEAHGKKRQYSIYAVAPRNQPKTLHPKDRKYAPSVLPKVSICDFPLISASLLLARTSGCVCARGGVLHAVCVAPAISLCLREYVSLTKR